LIARKAALDPKDTVGAQELTKEILRYNADLKVVSETQKKLQDQQAAMAAAAPKP
jgi:hypothetical protein